MDPRGLTQINDEYWKSAGRKDKVSNVREK